MTTLSQFSEAIEALVDKTARRVVGINAGSRNAASGILWRAGLIVTADEALGDDERMELTMPDGKSAGATLAGRDASTDIALLRVEGEPGESLNSLHSATAAKAGRLAIAVGRGTNGEIAALGVVKECGESWRSWAGGLIARRIVLDLDLDDRAHGGAVIDAAGDLIGLAAFAPRRRTLVIPAETVDRIAQQLAAKGSIARGYLGAGLHPLRQQRAGAIVVGLDDNGPAKRAGLFVGDILTAWNGDPIQGVHDVFRKLGPDTVGSTVALGVTRADQQITVDIVVGERPHR